MTVLVNAASQELHSNTHDGLLHVKLSVHPRTLGVGRISAPQLGSNGLWLTGVLPLSQRQ